MKKRLIALTALLLALLTGCTLPPLEETVPPAPDPLIGTWKIELDLAAEVRQMLTLSAELEPYFAMKTYPVTVVLRFYEDGTYTVEADEASAQAAFDGLLKSLEDALEALLQDRIDAVDPALTADVIEGWTGISFEEILSQAIEPLQQGDPTAYILEQARAEGNYQTAEDRLYLSLGKENAVNPDICDLYALNSDTLILMTHKGPKIIGFWENYPLVFVRIAE